ncbi:MAG TPA: trypsin-like peptidase domain-containing protein [bacterium]|mgnify:CR=1 FL=1|nr:trypsin-like peptidase domain-containing protein [bacterium]HQG44908.1 trypsin-like peptidase domain-containing protein [bacterium]HQI49374.1 trypsin-like peptidase domain-containing protein [bacterium]HQJ66236.1 trypsin-like peptidase domain-containing protein [bacterium]
MRRFILLFSLGLLPMVATAQDGTVLMRFEQDMRRLVDKVKPSVVTVSAQVPLLDLIQGSGGEDEQFAPDDVLITNVGSGVIFDSLHVITHISVVMNSENITITTQKGLEIPASLLGVDNEYGIAVLRSSMRLHHPAVLMQAMTLAPGSYVTVVGNALGVSSAVSWGIVNAIRQDGLIQLAANIPAGNAGGPVFDSSGRLAGLLAGLIVANEDAAEENFQGDAALAYPMQEIAAKVRQIIGFGRSESGWVGVTAEDWPGGQGWVHISDVRPGSPAQEAGLRIGDIILSLDGNTLQNSLDLAHFVRRNHPGQMMALGILRGDSTHILNVRIGSASRRPGAGMQEQYRSMMSRVKAKPQIQQGLRLREEQQRDDELRKRVEALEKELTDLRKKLKE